MINPFQYGGVVTEESFCNRKKELAEVLRVMENSGRAFLSCKSKNISDRRPLQMLLTRGVGEQTENQGCNSV